MKLLNQKHKTRQTKKKKQREDAHASVIKDSLMASTCQF